MSNEPQHGGRPSLLVRARAILLTLYRRVIRHAAVLLGGNAVGSVFGLLTTIVITRALEPSGLGRIVLVQAYVQSIDGLVNFQSWRTLVRFGSGALERGDKQGLARVAAYALRLDVISAIVACGLGLALLWPASHLVEWDTPFILATGAYSVVYLFNLQGVPLAMFRMHKKFKILAAHKAGTAMFKLFLVCMCSLLGAEPIGFLIAWMVADLINFSSLFVLGALEYRRGGYPWPHEVGVRGVSDEHPGILGYCLEVNAATAVRSLSKRLDLIIVGGALGEAALGLYKTARQAALVLGQLQDPLYQVLFPDLAADVAVGRRKAFVRNLLMTTSLSLCIAVGGWFGVYFLGEWGLGTLFGASYVPAYGVLVWYAGAICMGLAALAVSPAVLALGRSRWLLVSNIGATIAYFLLLSPLLSRYGLQGAGIAYFVFYIVWIGLMLWGTVSGYRRWQPQMRHEDA
ncbi:MAG: O-antigen/teichoic acid export membrane protein [Bradymonadia bacterium]|jgi:O-antigen/teichoic acid export membrane protein